MKTIHLLPISDPKTTNFAKAFRDSQTIATSLEFIPETLETLKAIDYMDLKLLLKLNDKFYQAAIGLCQDIIIRMIEDVKSISRKKSVKKAQTLEDLLNSGYYAPDYDTSRSEFINVLTEDYLYEC